MLYWQHPRGQKGIVPIEKYIIIQDFKKNKLVMQSIKKWGLLVIFFIESIWGLAQSNDFCKYQAALSYLRCDRKVSEKIKQFFPKQTLKAEEYVELNISNRIDFLSITPFKTKLLERDYFTEKELLKNDSSSYHRKYFFESYESDFLEKLIEPNNSKLYLTFSRPFGNYLIVEIGDLRSKDTKYRFGKGMHIFFRFDALGLIGDVIYAGSIYG